MEKINSQKGISIKDFYEKQWWNIDQLVSSFWSSLINSSKKSIERWNFESIENVIRAYDLFITSRTKDFKTCARECWIENIERDLDSCRNQAIMKQFCKYKDLYLNRIDNDNINFLNFNAIKIITPQWLTAKQIIKEIRDWIQHSRCVCLPEWLYIDNPQWQKHKIDFRAIIKPDFLLSIWKIYYQMQKYHMDDVDCREVKCKDSFEENKNNIKITRISLKNKKSEIPFIEFLKDEGMLELEDRKARRWESEILETINRNLTKWESKILSDFFWDRSFWEKEWELKLDIWMRQTDLSYKILMRLMYFLKSRNCSFEDLYNNRWNRHYTAEFLNFIWDSSNYRNLMKKYSIQKIDVPPITLKSCLDDLIYKILLENKWFLSEESTNIKAIVYENVKSRIYNQIYEWKDFTEEQKKLHIDLMVEDAMMLFDNEYDVVYGKYLQSEIGLNWVLNHLKSLYISNYYINDPSFHAVWNVENIPEREHLRNAFWHGNYLTLPWVGKILLRDPSQRKWSPDRERVYNIDTLYKRCLTKSKKRFI